ncbi:MAG TPA: NAD(P)-dependent oxidoreductase [Longimicrobiales bacterium]
MIPRTFITGGSGFVGRRLVSVLLARGASLALLTRSARPAPDPAGGAIETVQGDLLEPHRYAAALAGAGVVVHLAAATGRAAAGEHMRTNAEGTEVLLEHARRAGVERFLFVSSIAAGFPDVRDYPYARAKQRAEAAVRSSGLRYTILRPTMVLGPRSPILAALEKLAALPVIPIFGHGRTRVQPIHVDDLVDFIADILTADRFRGETLEVGGDRSLSIEELVQAIRVARRGVRGPAVHLPLQPLRWALRAGESLRLGRFLPVSAGQLSSFRFDGTIESNPLFEGRRAGLRGITDMVAGGRAA